MDTVLNALHFHRTTSALQLSTLNGHSAQRTTLPPNYLYLTAEHGALRRGCRRNNMLLGLE